MSHIPRFPRLPLAAAAALVLACGGDKEPAARADLDPLGNSGVKGTVTLTDLGGGKVRVAGVITGLKPGKHGFHVHEFGDCSSSDGKSAGEHFNPFHTDHGAPSAGEKHPGDFGNLEADAEGRAEFRVDTEEVGLGEGKADVLGRAMIVHAQPDDFSQPSGNAGERVACGVIMATRGETEIVRKDE